MQMACADFCAASEFAAPVSADLVLEVRLTGYPADALSLTPVSRFLLASGEQKVRKASPSTKKGVPVAWQSSSHPREVGGDG